VAYDGSYPLQKGDNSSDVSDLQNALEALGFSPGGNDGDFGSRTQDAVEAFQAANQLPVTGVVDADTWAAISAGGYDTGDASDGPTAERLVDLCLSQVNDVYERAGGHDDDDKANADQDEFDCSGLITWACAQLGVDIDGTAQSIIDMCQPISVAEAASIRGAVFFGPPSPGSWASGHIGVSTGDGGWQVDASGGFDRVVVREIQWDYWTQGGLLPGIVYDGVSSPA
jgi:cell wall-associated NlpC family hydrolase